MSQVQLCLARTLLQTYFGDAVERVALVLASKGPLPLPLIIQNCKLPGKLVKESLFVLIHHNLVQYRMVGEEDSPNRITLYRFDVERLFLRMAYPIFASKVEEKFDLIGVKIFLEVAKHGKWAANSISDGNQQDTLNKMISEGFLEYIDPNCSIWEEDSTDSSANPFAPVRSPTKKKTLPLPHQSPIKSPKRPRLEVQDSTKSFIKIKDEIFLRLIWEDLLVGYAGGRVNEAGATTMRSVLSTFGTPLSNSFVFNAFQVSTKLPPDTPLLVETLKGGKSLTERSSLSQYLDCLSQELDFFVKNDFISSSGSSNNSGTYSINFTKAFTRLKMNIIEAFIASKFGKPSARIFKILQEKKMLEEKTISKIALMTAKETRIRLYQLFKYGLLHLQEVPKTLDHAPSRTFFLWTIPTPNIYSTMSQMTLKMIYNLMERLDFERKKHELLILKSERSDVVANPNLLSDAEQKQLKQLRKVLNRLSFHCFRVMKEYLVLGYCNF